MSLAIIETLLMQKIGLDVTIVGSRKIARAVETRRSVCGLPDVDAYLKLLQTSNSEFGELVEQIVVPETWFFRDRKPFDLLLDYGRSGKLLKSGAKLRLLSAPCSTGEEPYSIAIALMEAGISAERISIDAIDISKLAIAKAERAIYGKNSFRGEDWINRQRYFQKIDEGYEVCASVRKAVTFRQGNVLNPSMSCQPHYDVIFCRNLLIYLDASACTQLFSILDRLLSPTGLLLVGAADTGKVPHDRFTSIRQPCAFAYQKAIPSTTSTKPLTTFKTEKSSVSPQCRNLPHSGINPLTPVAKPLPSSRQFTAIKNDRPVAQPASKPGAAMAQVTATASSSGLQLAEQLADAGHVEAAITQCQQCLEDDPANVDAYTLMGILHQAKTDDFQAEQCFRKALYLSPHHYDALMHLALLKEHRGDVAGASILQQRIQKLQQSSR